MLIYLGEEQGEHIKYHIKDKYQMMPLSKTLQLMDTTPQAKPRDYGHTTVAQWISPWLLMILV